MWLERLKQELAKRGVSLHKTAELTGIRYELLRRSFNESRELRARELIAILEKIGIQFDEITQSGT